MARVGREESMAEQSKSRRRTWVGVALVVLAAVLALFFLRTCGPPPLEGRFDYFRAKAAELGFDADEVRDFVREEVRTLAYRGDVKGALGALWEGAGSPEEKRALTVALLEHCP
ncbi:MAG: hypothetical protein ACYTG3_15770, partial [Planctomycetota bacterium]